MKRSTWFVLAVGVLVVVGIVFALLSREGTPAEEASEVSPPALTSSSAPVAETQPKTLSMPTMQIDKSKTYIATLHTTAGDIVIQLDAKTTPITANNFVYLAEKHFYDNTIFHRVIKGFMIQGGDPTGTGMGGPGYTFKDEPFQGSYTRGTVAMANAGPNTNGSQFFIMQEDNPLPPNYVIFGHVTRGLDVVDAIANAPVEASPNGEMSKPVNPVTVESVTIATQ